MRRWIRLAMACACGNCGKPLAVDAVVFELPRETQMRGVVFRNDQKPRSVLIQPVDNSRPDAAAGNGEVIHMVKQRIH